MFFKSAKIMKCIGAVDRSS